MTNQLCTWISYESTLDRTYVMKKFCTYVTNQLWIWVVINTSKHNKIKFGYTQDEGIAHDWRTWACLLQLRWWQPSVSQPWGETQVRSLPWAVCQLGAQDPWPAIVCFVFTCVYVIFAYIQLVYMWRNVCFGAKLGIRLDSDHIGMQRSL